MIEIEEKGFEWEANPYQCKECKGSGYNGYSRGRVMSFRATHKMIIDFPPCPNPHAEFKGRRHDCGHKFEGVSRDHAEKCNECTSIYFANAAIQEGGQWAVKNTPLELDCWERQVHSSKLAKLTNDFLVKMLVLEKSPVTNDNLRGLKKVYIDNWRAAYIAVDGPGADKLREEIKAEEEAERARVRLERARGRAGGISRVRKGKQSE